MAHHELFKNTFMLQSASSAKPFQVKKIKSLRKFLGLHVNESGLTQKSRYQIESFISNRDSCLGTVRLENVSCPGCQRSGSHENGVASPAIHA